MKRNYVEGMKTIVLGVFYLVLYFLGKGNSINREILLYVGGLLVLISIAVLFIERFSKDKVNKRIGYVNKNDERNVSIRCKAGNATYQVISIFMWIALGISFSGILPLNQLDPKWPIYGIGAIFLINMLFIAYYAGRE